MEQVNVVKLERMSSMFEVGDKANSRTFTRLEIIQKIHKEPLIKVKEIMDVNGNECNFVYSSNNNLSAYVTDDKSRFIIVPEEKKLKKMSFGIALKILTNLLRDENTRITNSSLKSVATGEDWDKSTVAISDEAYEGLWTVDGVNED